MTRTAAREIAVHFTFELGFTGQTAEALLAQAMNRTTFASIGEEEPLYSEYPNETQRAYISALVKGVYEHAPELDEYISRYAIGWNFARLNRVAVAIMRVAMYEILYMQDIPNAAAINEGLYRMADFMNVDLPYSNTDEFCDYMDSDDAISL